MVTKEWNADDLVQGYSGSGIFIEIDGKVYAGGVVSKYEPESKRFLCIHRLFCRCWLFDVDKVTVWIVVDKNCCDLIPCCCQLPGRLCHPNCSPGDYWSTKTHCPCAFAFRIWPCAWPLTCHGLCFCFPYIHAGHIIFLQCCNFLVRIPSLDIHRVVLNCTWPNMRCQLINNASSQCVTGLSI